MKKIIKKKNRLSRETLSNPFPNGTLKERLVRSKAIDYNDNCNLVNLGNGYTKVVHKDEEKLVKL